MNRYWVLFDSKWELDSIEFKGLPSKPPTDEGVVCEPGHTGAAIFRAEELNQSAVRRIRNKAFDVVIDAQDELSAVAHSLVLVGRMKEMCDVL
jgi:hypothetical protein